MKNLTAIGVTAGVLIACVLATPAVAAGPLTYVSATGADAGACATPATACRTFAFALAQTTDGGEIRALDSASTYGAVVINKSVKLIGAPGAGITKGLGGALILVNTPASARVEITGLILDGNPALNLGNRTVGVDFIQGGDLTIRDCLIRNHRGLGISASAALASRILIENTTIEGIGRAGILVGGVGNPINATLNNVTLTRSNFDGLVISGPNTVVGVTNSVISNNGADGVFISSGVLRLSRSVSMNNTGHGVNVFGGSAESAGDNFLGGNLGGPILGALTNVGRF